MRPVPPMTTIFMITPLFLGLLEGRACGETLWACARREGVCLEPFRTRTAHVVELGPIHAKEKRQMPLPALYHSTRHDLPPFSIFKCSRDGHGLAEPPDRFFGR